MLYLFFYKFQNDTLSKYIDQFSFPLRFSKSKTGIENKFTFSKLLWFRVGVLLNVYFYCLVFKTFISIHTKHPNNLVLESHSLVN